MARKFSDQEDSTLIAHVNNNPHLYNTKSRNQNPEMKETAWSTIAGAVGRDAAACKKRWRDIKDHYYKVRRRQGSLKAERYRKCKWPLYNALSFLSKVYEETHNVKIVKVESLADENNEEDAGGKSEEAESESSSELPTDGDRHSESEKMSDIQENAGSQSDSPKRSDDKEQRFREFSPDAEVADRQRLEGNIDDVDLFMRSVAITMKKLPVERIAQAKVEILLLVSKLQFPSQFWKD